MTSASDLIVFRTAGDGRCERQVLPLLCFIQTDITRVFAVNGVGTNGVTSAGRLSTCGFDPARCSDRHSLEVATKNRLRIHVLQFLEHKTLSACLSGPHYRARRIKSLSDINLKDKAFEPVHDGSRRPISRSFGPYSRISIFCQSLPIDSSPEAGCNCEAFELSRTPSFDSTFFLIQRTIDSTLSWEQLTASDINFSIVRPLVQKYARLENLSVVYACLVVRSYFLGASEDDLAYSSVMLTRANLCEIMAMKLLNGFAGNHIQLVAALTTSWNPLAGAMPDIIEDVSQALGDEDVMNSPQSALEMAIATQAKHLLSTPVAQRVVNDIYSGRVRFTTPARLLSLIITGCVPRYGAILEFMNFGVLLVTFVLCLFHQDPNKMNAWEATFILFALSFALQEWTASTEHGWIIYIANMWNVFDTSFILVFISYLGFRIHGLAHNNVEDSMTAFDLLACGACILFPRLAFFAVSNNVVILALRAMIAEFVFFMGMAAICFSGLLFTLWTLASGSDSGWTLKGIAWLMVQIWFGNTYLSFGQASSFHPLFGPILMTGFAALSNTLLLTILISILSNTFARIDANANREYLFQFAIATIEGVKSDALFSYQPPFNILAFIILKPASFVLTPRALHSLNVLLIKLTTFPILILIAIYERYLAAGQKLRESGLDAAHNLFNSLPRQIKTMPIVEALVGSSSNDLYDAIFDLDIPQQEFNDLFDGEDDEDELPALRSTASRDNVRPPRSGPTTPRKRPTSLPRSPLRDRSSPHASPRPRVASTLAPINLEAAHLADAPVERSPLARLFAPKIHTDSSTAVHVEATLKKMESVVEDMRGLPVQKLKDEMKELQDRQARIENLLLMLTRGMRNELGHRDTL